MFFETTPEFFGVPGNGHFVRVAGMYKQVMFFAVSFELSSVFYILPHHFKPGAHIFPAFQLYYTAYILYRQHLTPRLSYRKNKTRLSEINRFGLA